MLTVWQAISTAEITSTFLKCYFEISRVGRTDDRSRKKFVGKSRNAYVDQVTQETGRHSPVELPVYLEVLP